MSRMNVLQNNLYSLLIEFDELCRKYDIKYFLAAGTALGAVRHNRFLPWDDDMDLYITRDNWNKLRHVLETKDDVLLNGRSFAYHEATDFYRNPIPRYINNETTTIYKTQALAGKACGQHLELLIMDPMPKGKEAEKEYIDLLRVYTELLSPFFVVCKYLSLDEWKKHFEVYEKYFERANSEGDIKVLEEIANKLQSYSKEESETYCMRWGNVIYTYPKEHLEESRMEMFEERKFPVSKHAESMLRIAYGDDWMYVPEMEDQVVRNPLTNLNTPFKKYTDIYLDKINRNVILEKYRKIKHSNAKVFYNRRKVDMLVAKANVIAKSRHISKKLDGKEEYLQSLLEHKDYLSLSQEFKSYSELQMMGDVKKYNIIVPISDKNFLILLLSLIEQGKYYEANKFLNIRKMQEKELSNELKDIDELINICRELSIARYDNKDIEKAQSLIDKYENKYPELIDIYWAKLWILENKSNHIDDFKEIDRLCDEILGLYPFDGEAMAIQAKAKLDLGNNEEAMNLYKKAIYHTRNGVIWQKVEDETGISRTDIERDLIEGGL